MATPEQWDALRATIHADFERLDELNGQLTATGGWDGYEVVLGAAHYLAVRRQFPSGHTAADVIQLAADVRATFSENGQDLDAKPIELLACSALGETELAEQVDDKAVLTAQMVTVSALAQEHRLGDPDEFYREVEALATKWGA